MKKLRIYLIYLSSLILLCSCADYVQNVELPNDTVNDEQLNSEDQFTFLIRGVKQRFSTVQDDITILAGGLSDEMYFTNAIKGATYQDYKDIDRGNIKIDNIAVENVFRPLGELRMIADDLVGRTAKVTFTDTDLQNEAYFTGYLYGGIARYFYAAYFGLNPTQGGGVIDNGPFIPSSSMYALAIQKLDSALVYAPSEYDSRVVNSIIARCYLYSNLFNEALPYAENGLKAGDDPLLGLHHTSSTNDWYNVSGRGRKQFTLHIRFNNYINTEPLESNRVLIFVDFGQDMNEYFFQNKMPKNDDPLIFINWQENNLILAELALRGVGSSDALTLVNEIRSSYINKQGQAIPDLTNIDITTLIIERDKELFTTGARLVDQRRFNIWHLQSADSWRYLPIPMSERNENPNL